LAIRASAVENEGVNLAAVLMFFADNFISTALGVYQFFFTYLTPFNNLRGCYRLITIGATFLFA